MEQTVSRWLHESDHNLAGSERLSTITFSGSDTVEATMDFSRGNAYQPIRLTNVATPTASNDAVNKAYVDATARAQTPAPPISSRSLHPEWW